MKKRIENKKNRKIDRKVKIMMIRIEVAPPEKVLQSSSWLQRRNCRREKRSNSFTSSVNCCLHFIFYFGNWSKIVNYIARWKNTEWLKVLSDKGTKGLQIVGGERKLIID